MCRCNCVRASKNYLLVLNSLFLLVSLIVIGFSTYMLVKYDENDNTIGNQGFFAATLAIGIGVLAGSILGFYAATRQKKVVLAFYLVFSVILTLGLIGLAIADLVEVARLYREANADEYEGPFHDILGEQFRRTFLVFGIILLVLGVLMLFGVISTIYLLVTEERQKSRNRPGASNTNAEKAEAKPANSDAKLAEPIIA